MTDRAMTGDFNVLYRYSRLKQKLPVDSFYIKVRLASGGSHHKSRVELLCHLFTNFVTTSARARSDVCNQVLCLNSELFSPTINGRRNNSQLTPPPARMDSGDRLGDGVEQEDG